MGGGGGGGALFERPISDLNSLWTKKCNHKGQPTVLMLDLDSIFSS